VRIQKKESVNERERGRKRNGKWKMANKTLRQKGRKERRER
jgi:hypothetical protein